ncbi:MAG: CTP synthase [Firmicutes bacterium]|nr:CTP synthase [Bacillota bacterium]
MKKYVFVTGGVVSGLGKGITAASLGRLLKGRGYRIVAQKLDPYINIDPGTMSPYQHGEVYVTEDGAETDLDLGHYERFIDENLNRYSNLTTGRVYWNILNKERNGDYLGSTVQVIPHVTDEIKSFVYQVGKTSDADIIITEIGGTVGDIESQPFLEAIRQISCEVGRDNCVFIHVTPLLYIESSGEYKTKPTQHSVKELRGLGISPDIIVLRAKGEVDDSIREKIAMFCNVKKDCVISNQDVNELYYAPLMLEATGFSEIVCKELGIPAGELSLDSWNEMVKRIDSRNGHVIIGLVGKYTKLHDAYLSVAEALAHAGYENGVFVDIKWIEAEELTEDGCSDRSDEEVKAILGDMDGILIPGGFGTRGIAGKIRAARYAREHDIPLLGICLGMQIAVIEYARNVLGWKDADSSEFNEASSHKVIDFMPDQRGNIPKGGTMRLGAYPCKAIEGSVLEKAYGTTEISERHRHRYEFNNEFRDALTEAGLKIAGTSPDGMLVEAVELPEKRFYVGVQYHPDFKSRPNAAHPLFRELVRNAKERKEE